MKLTIWAEFPLIFETAFTQSNSSLQAYHSTIELNLPATSRAIFGIRLTCCPCLVVSFWFLTWKDFGPRRISPKSSDFIFFVTFCLDSATSIFELNH